MNKSNALILIASSLLSVALLELGIRWVAPQELVRPYFQPHAELGVTPQPGLDYFDSYDMPFYEHRIQTNAIGARMEAPVDLSATTQRILVTGDSFAFGLGVERQDSFVGIIQKQLEAEKLLRRPQLINMGIPSYSNGHVRKQLPLLLPVTQPNKVLYFINSNDLNDNFITNAHHRIFDILFKDDGAIETTPVPAYSGLKHFLLLKTPYPWLDKNSHLWILLKNNFFKDFGTTQPNKKLHQTSGKLIDLALHHVQHIATDLKKKNIPLQIVWISHPCQLQLSEGPQCDLDYSVFEKRLASMAEQEDDVSFFSSTPGLVQNMASHQRSDYFYPDKHFNIQGYRIFADIVYPMVMDFVKDGE